MHLSTINKNMKMSVIIIPDPLYNYNLSEKVIHFGYFENEF